jgi:hypothetical protein
LSITRFPQILSGVAYSSDLQDSNERPSFVKAADSKVFKLVTQGTLEEKISAIIDRNRNLMDDVIKEDSAELLKAFNREDLLVMLTPEPF